MKENICFFLLTLLLIVPKPTWGQVSTEHAIFLKEITTDMPCKEAEDFECGSSVYPDYASDGLPSDFGIKREPGIVIPGSAFKMVKVKAEIAQNWSAWNLEIKLTDDFGKKLENYTANKDGKRLAFVIDGKVLLIVTVLDKISSEFQVTSTKDRIEGMAELLKIVHPEITREIVKISSNTPAQ